MGRQASPDDVQALSNKIDVVGVSGLLVSVSGFTPAAIQMAQDLRHRCVILLMDGDDIREALRGGPDVKEQLTALRYGMDSRSIPYRNKSEGRAERKSVRRSPPARKRPN
ncbi:hypothetical protein GOZ91_22715 [Agrobacterium vitis]|nr:hypothetical protein [Agrobacterium vitis]